MEEFFWWDGVMAMGLVWFDLRAVGVGGFWGVL